jgi:hypothetical protein
MRTMKLREASSEETEERLKNAQYQLVTPLKWKKSTKTSLENNDGKTPSEKETKKKE